MSLTLKCVTCRQHTVGSRSSLSTFLIGMFNTFTACKSLCLWARTAEVAILKAFQSLLRIFYSHIFLLSFGSGSYFHNCYWPLSSWVSVATDCFWQRPWGLGFPADQVLSSSQVKRQQWNRAFPGSWTTGQIGTMLWEWPFFSFWGAPASPAHPVAASLLVFKVTADLSRETWEQFKLQCHKPCSMRFSSFSWINTPQIVGSLWQISRVLK